MATATPRAAITRAANEGFNVTLIGTTAGPDEMQRAPQWLAENLWNAAAIAEPLPAACLCDEFLPDRLRQRVSEVAILDPDATRTVLRQMLGIEPSAPASAATEGSASRGFGNGTRGADLTVSYADTSRVGPMATLLSRARPSPARDRGGVERFCRVLSLSDCLRRR